MLEQINEVIKEFGFPMLTTVPHVGKAVGRKPWREYYDDRTKRLVYNRYKEDFSFGEYESEVGDG